MIYGYHLQHIHFKVPTDFKVLAEKGSSPVRICKGATIPSFETVAGLSIGREDVIQQNVVFHTHVASAGDPTQQSTVTSHKQGLTHRANKQVMQHHQVLDPHSRIVTARDLCADDLAQVDSNTH